MKPRQQAFFRLVAVIALLCALGGGAIPSLAKPHGQHPAAVSGQLQRFSVSGTVGAVDYDANSVTINSGSRRSEVTLTPTTTIDDRGEVGGIADIHRGRKITATGVVRNGTLVAQSIRLR
jgi:hypothetical protein